MNANNTICAPNTGLRRLLAGVLFGAAALAGGCASPPPVITTTTDRTITQQTSPAYSTYGSPSGTVTTTRTQEYTP